MAKLEEPFFVIKLKTGEIVFAEVLSSDDKFISMMNPLQIHVGDSGENRDTMYGTEWMPFVDQEVYQIPMNMIFFVGYLNDKFKKFYGSVLLQTEISRIKQDVADNMSDKMDYLSMLEGVEKMKSVVDRMAQKFNIDESLVDFSEFEKALDKFKEDVVLH